jgi:WD40 repeat protein/formylglycine-generating enzyme required for sulfatase activity
MSNLLDEQLKGMSPEKRSYLLKTLPTHLAEAGQVERLHRVLTNFPFLEAKAKTGGILQEGPNQGTLTVYTGVYNLQEDFNLALAKTPTFSVESTVLSAFQNALRKEIHTISEYPDLLWQQLFNQLSWEGQALQEVLVAELDSRMQPGAGPWLHSLLPQRQSPGFVRELYHHIQTPYGLWAGAVRCCSFSPDGLLLAILGTGLPEIFNVQSGQVAAQLAAPGDYGAFSEDGHAFVIVGVDSEKTGTEERQAFGVVQLWETTSWTLQTRFRAPLPEEERFRTGSFNPFSRLALVASDDHFTIWNIATGNNLGTFAAQVGIIRDCAFDRHGRHLVIGGDLALTVWDTATWTLRYRVPADGNWNSVFDCSISPDGQWIVTSHIDSSIKLRHTATGDIVWTLTTPHQPSGLQHGVLDTTFSPDGTLIASVGADHLVKLWDRATGELRGMYAGHEMNIQSCAFSPDGAYLVSGGDDSKTILWDLSVHTTDNARASWHNQTIHGCAFSPDGAYFVTASSDHTAKIWYVDLVDEALRIETLPKHQKTVRACAIHPDGEMIVTGADDASLSIWKQNGAFGTFVTRLRHSFDQSGYNMAGGYPITECAISPDGAWAIAALHNKVEQWDLVRLRWMRDFSGPAGTIHTCAISPDGAWVVTGDDDGKLSIWESQTGVLLHSLPSEGGKIARCAISPDGTSIAAATSDWGHLSKYTLHYETTADRSIIVWTLDTRTDTWQPRHRLVWRTRYITACAFSPDGQYLLAADDSGIIKVWELNGGVEKRHYRTNQLLYCLALHPSLPIILGGGEGGSMVLAGLVGLTYGPIVVTPFRRENRIHVQCPRCSRLIQPLASLLGQTTLCPRCDLALRINAFVLKRISPAWLDHSASIAPYNPELEVVDMPVVGGSTSEEKTTFHKHASFVPETLRQLGFSGEIIRGQQVIIPPVVLVEEGPFLMGSLADDPLAYEEERPQHTVTLPAYQIGKYPLTVAEYACAVRAGVVIEPAPIDPMGWVSGREPITWEVQLRHPDHPVVSLSLSDYVRYTRWLSAMTGGRWRVSSEAEWEKAARGTDGRMYPWGNHWDPTCANTDNRTPEQLEQEAMDRIMNDKLDRSAATLQDFLRINADRLEVNGITPVGAYPKGASPYGAMDMAGNVWEVTVTVWPSPYPYNLHDGRDNVAAAVPRVLRGGSWYFPERLARCACRYTISHPRDHCGARLVLEEGEEPTFDFGTWFKEHTGEDLDSCDWFITFIRSNDANEVELVFEEHYSILMADEVVEELEGMMEIMKGRLPHPAAFYAIMQAQDRLTLIADARSMGVQEAIEMHKLPRM